VAETITLESNKLDDYDYHFDDLPASEKADSENPLFKYSDRNFIKKILYFSSGTDLQLIQNCPHSDKVKMQCIGGTVLATAVLAFLSGSFAFYTVFGPKPELLSNQGFSTPINWGMVGFSIFFGFIWASIIFNLDRFIVSSLGHGDGTDTITPDEWKKAIPRIIMAVAIGFVISKPLELKIMESEITSKLIVTQQQKYEEGKAKVDEEFDKQIKVFADAKQEKQNQLDFLVQEEQAARKLKDEISDAVLKEIDGLSMTGKKGCGDSCKEKKAQQIKYEAEFNNKVEENKAKKAKLEQERDEADEKKKQKEVEKVQKYDTVIKQASTQNGLMARLEEVEKDPFLRHSGYFVMFLMIMLEISPLIFKMMITLSPYDYVQENIKLKSIARRGIFLNEEGEEIKLSNSDYYEAELIQAEQKGKRDIEIELLKEAHSIFKDDMKEKMRKDPHRFIDLVRMESGD
jgi:hypothetical protein